MTGKALQNDWTECIGKAVSAGRTGREISGNIRLQDRLFSGQVPLCQRCMLQSFRVILSRFLPWFLNWLLNGVLRLILGWLLNWLLRWVLGWLLNGVLRWILFWILCPGCSSAQLNTENAVFVTGDQQSEITGPGREDGMRTVCIRIITMMLY